MNTLTDLLQSFEKVENWLEVVRQNFDRKAGIYSFVTVTDITLKQGNNSFTYPTKIVFKSGYSKAKRNIVKTDKLLVNSQNVKIIEHKKIIPFGYYERRRKYSGDIHQILKDIVGTNITTGAQFSQDILTTRDNPLFSIDSKQKWASYLLILERNTTNSQSTEVALFEPFLDVLADYGIHYNYENLLQNRVVVVFPMPYIKIAENKIKRENEKESIFLVLQFNETQGTFYNSSFRIEINAQIKDTQQNVIYEKTELLKFGKAKFQVVELVPENTGEIGFAKFSISINGTVVDKFAGYYIRDIKVSFKEITQ